MIEQQPRIIDPRMEAIFRDLFPLNLQRFSRAMMMLMKQPREVKTIRVRLTHANIHRIFRSETKRSQDIRKQWPLEIRLPKLGEPDEVIDCRPLTVAWDIAIPPAKPSAPVNYPKDTGDPIKDFHPSYVEPLTVLGGVQPDDGSATESR